MKQTKFQPKFFQIKEEEFRNEKKIASEHSDVLVKLEYNFADFICLYELRL